MTKAENSRVAQSNEPSADRIAADLCAELARVKAVFQLRAIVAAIGLPTCARCDQPLCSCPDHHWKDAA